MPRSLFVCDASEFSVECCVTSSLVSPVSMFVVWSVHHVYILHDVIYILHGCFPPSPRVRLAVPVQHLAANSTGIDPELAAKFDALYLNRAHVSFELIYIEGTGTVVR